MKRITEKAWKRIARGRVRKAIKKLEAGKEESTGRCPVCDYMDERGIRTTSPSDGACTDRWYEIKCPAYATCKVFLHIIEDMLYRGSQIKRLKKLLVRLNE